METMESKASASGKLAWAVLAQTPTGRSEIIKVTDHEDADRTIQDNPTLYYKAGPIWLS